MGSRKTSTSKVDVCVTLSPYIVEKMDWLVSETTFSSTSDLVGVALAEFMVKFPDKEVKA